MSKNKLYYISLITGIMLVSTLIVFIICTIISCVKIANNISNSAPWWVGIITNFLYFFIPLIIEFILFLYFFIRYKH